MFDWFKEHKSVIFVVGIVFVLIGYYVFTALERPISHEEENSWNLSEEVVVEEEVEEEAQTEVIEEILVDVKGSVNQPGVYLAESGDRVIDLIEKAGGLNEKANESAINFAMRVTDEMVLYVPAIGEELNLPLDAGATLTNSSNRDKVNLNTATQSDLETLPGIGPAKAQTILEYREQNGPFQTIEDIMKISGFGEKTFEKLKDSISVH